MLTTQVEPRNGKRFVHIGNFSTLTTWEPAVCFGSAASQLEGPIQEANLLTVAKSRDGYSLNDPL